MSSLCIYNKSRLSHDEAHTMNLFIQMDFTMHIEKISMELSILYFKWSQVEISKLRCISVMKIFYLCKLCRLWWNAALCGISSGPHCLRKYQFMDIQNEYWIKWSFRGILYFPYFFKNVGCGLFINSLEVSHWDFICFCSFVSFCLLLQFMFHTFCYALSCFTPFSALWSLGQRSYPGWFWRRKWW